MDLRFFQSQSKSNMTSQQIAVSRFPRMAFALLTTGIVLFDFVGCGANPSTAAKVDQSHSTIKQLDNARMPSGSPEQEQYAASKKTPLSRYLRILNRHFHDLAPPMVDSESMASTNMGFTR